MNHSACELRFHSPWIVLSRVFGVPVNFVSDHFECDIVSLMIGKWSLSKSWQLCTATPPAKKVLYFAVEMSKTLCLPVHVIETISDAPRGTDSCP